MVESPSQPSWHWPRAAYIHVPFCAHRCGYCDFAVTASHDELFEPYVDALLQEVSALGEPAPVDSIFIGGGTPTYLPPALLEKLLTGLTHWVRPAPAAEFSIEATPESVSHDTLSVLADHGVNRVSLGVQSFQGRFLKQLDRIHEPCHIEPALERIRRRIDNVSLDLIFGIPGQTPGDWEQDLRQAIDHVPEHISTYGLTYEKGTPLWKDRQRGLVLPVAEDAELAMYELAMDRLAQAGYEQYEISNFARPGRECRHNETYWANDAYFGWGVGAARYVLGSREINYRGTVDYIRRVQAHESPTQHREMLTGEDAARETLAIQFRRVAGIERGKFQARTGYSFDSIVGNRSHPLLEAKLIDDDGTRVRLTRTGRCVADAVVSRLAFG